MKPLKYVLALIGLPLAFLMTSCNQNNATAANTAEDPAENAVQTVGYNPYSHDNIPAEPYYFIENNREMPEKPDPWDKRYNIIVIDEEWESVLFCVAAKNYDTGELVVTDDYILFADRSPRPLNIDIMTVGYKGGSYMGLYRESNTLKITVLRDGIVLRGEIPPTSAVLNELIAQSLEDSSESEPGTVALNSN